MNSIFHSKTGDGRVNRARAESLYTSLNDYLSTGDISSNPFLAKKLDNLAVSDRSAYINQATQFMETVKGYEFHGKKLEELTRSSPNLLPALMEEWKANAGSVEFDPESVSGVVNVGHHYYVKSPDSLFNLVKHLTEVGYDIKDVSSEESASGDKPPRSVQEKNGWLLWFGTLGESIFSRKGECGSCESLIEILGIHSHENECSNCGDYTYVKYVDGGEISFSVVDDDKYSLRNPTFVIHSFEKDNELLNLYVNPEDCQERQSRRMRNFDLSPEDSSDLVTDFLSNFPETFSKKKVNGVDVLSVNHKGDGYLHEHGINTSRVEGDRQNFSIVRLFKGKKFDEWGAFPIPETISIFEAWHWAPLEPSTDLYKKIMSAAGQVSRKDFYHQDGTPAFGQRQIDWMLTYINNFTTIDANSVAQHLNPRLSGPAFIDILAKQTGQDAFIETAPNIFNAIDFTFKLKGALEGSGATFTQEEADAAAVAIQDDMKKEKFLSKLFGRFE